jgi:hypothetical protein
MVRSGETATALIEVPMTLARTKSDRLRGLAADLEAIASAFDEPSRSIVRAEALIGRVETIATDIRAVARGR